MQAILWILRCSVKAVKVFGEKVVADIYPPLSSHV